MSITEDIRKAILSKLVIRHRPGDIRADDRADCVVCGKQFTHTGALCLYARGEGHVCETCGERFAPEMLRAMAEYRNKDVRQLLARKVIDAGDAGLTKEEWRDVRENLTALLQTTADLAKGISRGIVEAPAGHIGLLHLAKEITKPDRRDGESDKDYELRVKTFRMTKLHEKIKLETWGRVAKLEHYLIRLGLPESPGEGQ